MEGIAEALMLQLDQFFYRAKNKYKMDVYGIRDGTAGLIKRPVDVMQLTHKTFGGYLLRQVELFLGSTNKGNPFKFLQVMANTSINQKNYRGIPLNET